MISAADETLVSCPYAVLGPLAALLVDVEQLRGDWSACDVRSALSSATFGCRACLHPRVCQLSFSTPRCYAPGLHPRSTQWCGSGCRHALCSGSLSIQAQPGSRSPSQAHPEANDWNAFSDYLRQTPDGWLTSWYIAAPHRRVWHWRRDGRYTSCRLAVLRLPIARLCAPPGHAAPGVTRGTGPPAARVQKSPPYGGDSV